MIKDRVLQRNPDYRVESDKNFIHHNITKSKSHLAEREQKLQGLKIRQLRAKIKRDRLSRQELKNRILQLHRWPLIRFMRDQALGKKMNELEVVRFVREWRIRIAFHQLMSKLLENFKHIVLERKLSFAKYLVAISMVKRLTIFLRKRGLSYEDRMRKDVKYVMTSMVQNRFDVTKLRAKKILSKFMASCQRNMTFKLMLNQFLNGIYHIQNQVKSRFEQHKLKKAFLDQMYDSEIRNMKVFSFKHTKQKKFKTLALKLSEVTRAQKEALLDEYFNLCKIVYRIRSVVSYVMYQGDQSFKLLLELFND